MKICSSNNAPLTEREIKRVVARLMTIDGLIAKEYAKEEATNNTPNYWQGFFSGYESTPTPRCKQILAGITARTNKLSNEQSALFKQITKQQAEDFGYCVSGMDDEDFKFIEMAVA
jgi:hypothetical protein